MVKGGREGERERGREGEREATLTGYLMCVLLTEPYNIN